MPCILQSLNVASGSVRACVASRSCHATQQPADIDQWLQDQSESTQQPADIDLWLQDGCTRNQSCSALVPCIRRSVNFGLRFSQSLHDVTLMSRCPSACRH